MKIQDYWRVKYKKEEKLKILGKLLRMCKNLIWGNRGITFRERDHARKETGNIQKIVAFFGSSLEKI